MVHVLEVVSSPRDVRTAVEPGYNRLWEIDPKEPWEDVLERSARQGVLDEPTVADMAVTFD
jgi:hypothetical protein